MKGSLSTIQIYVERENGSGITPVMLTIDNDEICYLSNCSIMLYFSINSVEGRAIARMLSVILRN